MVKCRNSALKDFKLHAVTDSNVRLLHFFFFFCFVFHEIQGWVGKERNLINFLRSGTFPRALGAEKQTAQTHPLSQKVLFHSHPGRLSSCLYHWEGPASRSEGSEEQAPKDFTPVQAGARHAGEVKQVA